MGPPRASPQAPGDQPVSLARDFTRGLLVAAIYFVGGRVGLIIDSFHDNVTVVWPPSGIALAALILWGLRLWPAVALGALLVDITSGVPAPAMLGIAVGNTLQAVAGAYLLRRVAGFHPALDRVRDIVALVVLGSALTTLISAAMGALSLYFTGMAPGRTLGDVALTWWLGDAMGVLIVAPFLLTWATPSKVGLGRSRLRALEAVAAFTLLTAVSLFSFAGLITTSGVNPMLYSVFPCLMWTALRFGQRGAALGHLILTSIAVACTALVLGPFAGEPTHTSLMHLHSYATVVVMTSLFLGAATIERRAARDLAEQRAAELRVILDAMVEGVAVCDTRQRITMLSARMRSFLEARPDEPLPAPLAAYWSRVEIRHPSDEGDGTLSVDELPLIRAIAAGRPVRQRITLRQRRAGRDLHFDVIAAPHYGEEQDLRGAVTVWRDITEAVEFERIQEEFVRVAAHELKTPVAIVRAHAQALLRRGGVAGVSRARAESVLRGADRIARLADDLLDIMQLHAGQMALHMEDVQLSHLLGPILEDAGRSAPAHRLGLAGDADISVRLDRARVAQVVRGLVSNAIKYSPNGGDVTVRVARAPCEAVISVADHGVGIPAAKQPRIFERFYRPHSGTAYDYGGMGVGLYIAREIVRLHGGRIWFESREGVGSTFSFSLPLHGEERDHGL